MMETFFSSLQSEMLTPARGESFSIRKGVNEAPAAEGEAASITEREEHHEVSTLPGQDPWRCEPAEHVPEGEVFEIAEVWCDTTWSK
jgi:hypothetical protein